MVCSQWPREFVNRKETTFQMIAREKTSFIGGLVKHKLVTAPINTAKAVYYPLQGKVN